MNNIRVENYKEINQALVNKVFNQGLVKEAADAFSSFVRVFLREEGILRRALGAEIVGPDDIDRVDYTDNPVKIIDVQVDSKAFSVPFKGKGSLREYQGRRAVIEFTKYETEEFNIEKQRLLTYRHPVQEVLIQQGILDLQRAEDEIFIETLNKIAVDDQKAVSISTSGQGLTWEALVQAEQAFYRLRPANKQIPVKTIIVNNITFANLKKLPANAFFTPNLNEEIVREGVVQPLGGYNWVVTNKIDLVPENTMYLLTSQEYLGHFYLLQDATVFMKTEADKLMWRIYEIAGLGIITDGILKVTLT